MTSLILIVKTIYMTTDLDSTGYMRVAYSTTRKPVASSQERKHHTPNLTKAHIQITETALIVIMIFNQTEHMHTTNTKKIPKSKK